MSVQVASGGARARKAAPADVRAGLAAPTGRRAAEAAGRELGVSGLVTSFGGAGRASTIQDRTRKLSYTELISLYREMGRTPVFAAALSIFEALLSNVTYVLQPRWNSADPTLKLRAAFVQECLEDMGEQLELSAGMFWTALQYGIAPIETIYKVRRGQEPGTYVDAAGYTRERPLSRANDGMIGIDMLKLRPPGTIVGWHLNANQGVEGIVQLDPSTGREITIPAWKLMLYTNGSTSAPRGRSMFDGSVGVYELWKRAVEAEGMGLARRLAGTPHATVPAEWMQGSDDPDEQAARSNALAAMRTSLERLANREYSYLVTPAIYDEHGHNLVSVRLMGIEGTAGINSNEAIARHEYRMAASMAVSMVLLGQGSGGTQALASELSRLLRAGLNNLAATRAAVISQQLFGPLMRLNGWPPSEAPELVAQSLTETPSLGELSTAILSLANAGFIEPPDGALNDAWRAAAGLEAMREEDVLAHEEAEEEAEEEVELPTGFGPMQIDDDDDDAPPPADEVAGNPPNGLEPQRGRRR